MAQLKARKPKPLTDTQVAQQQLKPAVAAVTGAIQGQARSAADAVRGYTGSLAHELAGIDYQAPYRQAAPQQAAVDEALRASLAGQGSELSQGLASRLSMLNAPNAVNPAVQSVADFGSRAGTTAQANGSAALSELLANEAAAGTYGMKQPGIARLAGLQNLGRVEGQAQQDIADKTAPLYGQIPEIVAAIQTNRARQQQLSLENRLAAKKFGLEVTKANNATKVAADRSALAWGNLTEKQRHDLADEANAQQRANAAAQRAAATAAKQKHPKLTPGQAATIAAKAAKDAEDLYHGVTKPNSSDPANPIVVSYSALYQDAIKTLLNRYPSLGRAGVLKLVNTWYSPGGLFPGTSTPNGRPAKPAKIGSAAAPGPVQGHDYRTGG